MGSVSLIVQRGKDAQKLHGFFKFAAHAGGGVESIPDLTPPTHPPIHYVPNLNPLWDTFFI